MRFGLGNTEGGRGEGGWQRELKMGALWNIEDRADPI